MFACVEFVFLLVLYLPVVLKFFLVLKDYAYLDYSCNADSSLGHKPCENSLDSFVLLRI